MSEHRRTDSVGVPYSTDPDRTMWDRCACGAVVPDIGVHIAEERLGEVVRGEATLLSLDEVERQLTAHWLEQHRPYGLDCKCGRPINSDGDWAAHVAEVLHPTKPVGQSGEDT